MLKLIKNFEKTLLMLAKVFLILIMYVIFYAFFLSESPELLRLSRVSTIISSSFLVLCYIMLRLYEGTDFGKKSTRELSLSIILAVIFTDIFTFCQLCIMEKRILPLRILIAIIILHSVVSPVLTKLINGLFTLINKPLSIIIVYNQSDKSQKIKSVLSHYQHRYKIEDICTASDKNLYKKIKICDGVFIDDIGPEKEQTLIDYCYSHNKTVIFNPSFTDILIHSSSHEMLDDYSVYVCNGSGLSFDQRFIKRLSDIVFSSLCLTVLSPVFLIEALAIKLQDGGKVFFTQERCTENGRLFKVLKFRTMIENAEKNTGAVLADRNDSRITKIGSFLRKTRLDEIPQLINVLKGDMSIVGPRPERRELAQRYENELPQFPYRLKVKAGLTGLAQIYGKYSTSPKDKLVLDLIYIKKYSLILDIKIILRTIIVILTPEKSF